MVKVARLSADLWIVDTSSVWLSDYRMLFFYTWVCTMYSLGTTCGLQPSQSYRNQQNTIQSLVALDCVYRSFHLRRYF